MPNSISGLSSSTAVIQAIQQCDQVGQEAFLAQHAYTRSRRYVLRHQSNTYDAVAIAGVAYALQHGATSLKPRHVRSEAQIAVATLRKLGFEVIAPSLVSAELRIGQNGVVA